MFDGFICLPSLEKLTLCICTRGMRRTASAHAHSGEVMRKSHFEIFKSHSLAVRTARALVRLRAQSDQRMRSSHAS